jgi:MinD superfamily P-loop ATPase
MKELVVLSGKGGTGKTSVIAALASLAGNKILCDADVDAADLHLIMTPEILKVEEFYSGFTAEIDSNSCTECGVCRDLCHWDAINESFKVNPIDCEGCGVCVHFCPEDAIKFPINLSGYWYVSSTRFGQMVHAQLGIAEENSGKLVTLVRQESRKLAEEKGLDLILTDGPPGVGCPVIASMGGATAVLIVTEPTVSGKHDLERVVKLAEHFNVPAILCINKFDLNIDMTQTIESFATERGLPCLGRIPFDPVFTQAIVQAQTVFEYNSCSLAEDAVRKIWNAIMNILD